MCPPVLTCCWPSDRGIGLHMRNHDPEEASYMGHAGDAGQSLMANACTIGACAEGAV